VYLLCKKLGHLPDKSCIIIGDTPDDIRAGVAAGIRAYGVLTPDEEAKLMLKLLKSSQVYLCIYLHLHFYVYEYII
jgi:phosphoglycolate phosphatase-like HAD superfamily hydrolase